MKITGGPILRSARRQWSQACVLEDSELSVRVLSALLTGAPLPESSESPEIMPKCAFRNAPNARLSSRHRSDDQPGVGTIVGYPSGKRIENRRRSVLIAHLLKLRQQAGRDCSEVETFPLVPKSLPCPNTVLGRECVRTLTVRFPSSLELPGIFKVFGAKTIRAPRLFESRTRRMTSGLSA
jgi:hypothetical protein